MSSQNERRRDLKSLFDFSHVNFKKIKKLLNYGKETINDAEKTQVNFFTILPFKTIPLKSYLEEIKLIYQERQKMSQEVSNLLTEGVMWSK